MTDCTDIYYENHRVTVVASLNSILEAMSNLVDSGGVEDLSLTHDALDPNTDIYELPEDETQYANITITGYRENPDENYVIFLSYQYERKPFGEDNNAEFTKTLRIPEGQNYVYVVYVDLFEGGSAAGWAMKDNSGNIGVFANENDAQNFIMSDVMNFGTLSYHYRDPKQVPLDVAFDLINDHYDNFDDLPITMIYSDYEIFKRKQSETNHSYISFAKTQYQARNLLPHYSASELFIGTDGPSDGVYQRQFPVTPVADPVHHLYYAIIRINLKTKKGKVTDYMHTAYPVKVFAYESDADQYLSTITENLDIRSQGYGYQKYSFNIGHMYQFSYIYGVNNGYWNLRY